MYHAALICIIFLGITINASPAATITQAPAATIVPRKPFCIFQADPGNGMEDGSCVCSDSGTTSSAGPVESGLPCPWTKFPLTSATPVAGPKHTRTITTSYRSTDGLTVGDCKSVLVSPYNGVDVTNCLLPTRSISVLPHVTIAADVTSRQQVGELATFVSKGSIKPLYTSVSSALDKLCPTPSADGTPTSCKGTPEDHVLIKKVAYYTGGPGDIVYKDDGTLSISMGVSNYTSEKLRTGFIESIATLFQRSANNNTYCDMEQQIGDGNFFHEPKDRRICTAPGYVELLYMNQDMNGVGPAGSMMAKLNYYDPTYTKKQSLTGRDAIEACMTIVTIGAAILTAFFPEFAVADLEGGALADAACEVIGKKVSDAQSG